MVLDRATRADADSGDNRYPGARERQHKVSSPLGMYQVMRETWGRWFPGQQDLTDIEQLGFGERLGLLLDREATFRAERRLKYRLRNARLRQSAVIEDLDYRHPRGLDQALMNRLITGQ